jgi:undecaprenyl-diphosphatase
VDEALLLWVNQGWAHPWLDVLFAWVSDRVSFALPLVLVLLVVSVWRFQRDGLKLWLLLLLVVGIGDALGALAKDLIGQPRPCYELSAELRSPGHGAMKACQASHTGMPSNHALNFFTMAAFLGAVLRGFRWRVGLVALALVVAISRVYLGKHFPSQVLAGALAGTAVGLTAYVLTAGRLAFMRAIRARQVSTSAEDS